MRWAFEVIGGRPLIVIECNGRPLRCIIDTGYSGWLWMSQDHAKRHKIYPEDGVQYAKTASGIECEYHIGYAHRILIDPILHESVPVDIHGGKYAEYALLGIRALRDFTVILDFKSGFTEMIYGE